MNFSRRFKMKGFIVVVMIFALCNCSMAVKQAHEIDVDLATYLKDNTISIDCRGGIADAFILAPDTTADIRIAAEAVSKFAVKDSPDYKDCYSKAAWLSFMSRGIVSKGKKLLGTIATMGIGVP